MLRLLFSVVLVVATAYTLLAVFLFFYQDRLLYLPELSGRTLRATPAAIGLPYEDVRVTTVDGVGLHGWFVRQPAGGRVVLFFHGNAGNIGDRLEWLRILHRLGLQVLIFDYRGYGQSDGRPSEAGTYHDARAMWRHLVEERHIPPARIVLFGESLGGAVAAELARHESPAGLILHSSFTSIPELAAHLYPWLPVRWLTRFHYPTADYVAESTTPLLVIHSPDDEIVPVGHGREILQRAAGPKRFLEIFGDHNAGFVLSETVLIPGLSGFLATLPDADP